MYRIKTLFIISLFMHAFLEAAAQEVTTIIGPNSGINDALVVDSVGNIYGSDFGGSSTGASSVYKIDTDGVLSTFSTGYSSCNGLAFDHEGYLYVVDFTSNVATHQVYKLDENGGRTPYGPQINGASGIIFDPLSDTLYVSQYNGNTNRISKLSPDGSLTLHSDHEDLNGPVGMAFDNNHVLYVANFNDGKVFRVSPNGEELTLIADIPNQSFWGVGFLTFATGHLYATGIGTHKIYQISLAGDVVEFAGSGSPGLTDGLADEAEFNRPNGIATNKNQDVLYISDLVTYAVREIQLNPATNTEEVVRPIIESIGLSPNPAGDFVTLRYSLHKTSRVDLQLYSQGGQLIRHLMSEIQASGNHQFVIHTTHLSNGIYYCKKTSNGKTQSIKILVHH